MYLFNWFFDVLAYFGFYHKSGKLLFLGLDNAGKTTLLNKLTTNRIILSEPTIHPNSEELVIGKIKFRTYDLGGHEPARKLWKDYFVEVSAVVFIIDVEDRKRFPEACKELNDLLSYDSLVDVPFAVLGNKIDVAGAASEEEIRMTFNLVDTYGRDSTIPRVPGKRPVELFMTSIPKEVGYADAFRWISNLI